MYGSIYGLLKKQSIKIWKYDTIIIINIQI